MISPCPAGCSDLPAGHADNSAESFNLLVLILEVSIDGDVHCIFSEPAENQQEMEKDSESPDLFSFGPSARLAPYVTALDSSEHNRLIPNTLSLILEVCSPPPKFKSSFPVIA